MLHAPPGLALDLPEVASERAGRPGENAVLVFIGGWAELAERREPFLEAARRDALAWIAYPKAGYWGSEVGLRFSLRRQTRRRSLPRRRWLHRRPDMRVAAHRLRCGTCPASVLAR